MNFLTQAFQTILYQPLLNVLVILYVYVTGFDFGLAVVLLTLLIKLVLHPLSVKGMKSQKQMANLQPKIKELQNKYKDNRQEQSRALMDLYKKEGISPASGCLPLLIQLPIIIALYRVFLGTKEIAPFLYGFVPDPGVLSTTFLGVISLESKTFVIILALIASVAQFWQVKMSSSKQKSDKKDFAASMQKQMLFILPLLSFFLIWKIGAVIGLYWACSVLFSLVEQAIINKKLYGNKESEKNN